MSPVFPLEQREEIKTKLLEVGVSLIKEKGIKRITVEEVAKLVGIGKGTFYHFYQSKEWYVYDVICFSKDNMLNTINHIIAEKGTIDRDTLSALLESFSGSNNIISFITAEDEEWLAKKLPPECVLDPPKEEKMIGSLLEYMTGTRKNLNYHTLANIMKIMALTIENRKFLHQDTLEENLSLMREQLCNYIFEA